ncbi:MAG: hypothetical protein WCS86_02565 [Candidatus Paceibacterota bacterium]
MAEDLNLEGNKEIEEALKKLEMENAVEAIERVAPIVKNADAPTMVRWVMKLFGGLIKTQKQAEYVLVVFAIVIFGISLYLFFS